jgi:putative salt-induced outer membrane protein YdiY
MRIWVLVAATVATLAIPRHGRAQIVNVQSQIGEVPEGVSGQVDAAADFRRGNTNVLILSGAVTVRYKHDDHLVFAVAKGEYGEVGDPGSTFIKHTFEHLRYRLTLTPRFTVEAFAQHELDEFRRLKLRALAGAGGRFTLLGRANFSLVVGVAYMLEHEELDAKVGAADAGDSYTNHRLSSYLMGGFKLNDQVALSESVYLQPRLDEPSDLRVLNETQLYVKLNDRFSFKTTLVLAHDSDPPDLLKDTDVVLQSGISYKF